MRIPTIDRTRHIERMRIKSPVGKRHTAEHGDYDAVTAVAALR